MITEPAAAAKTAGWGAGGGGSKFCELFDTYQPALRRLVAVYVANPADREELLQEIAAGIWKSLPNFRGDASERTWIYRIAHNIAIRSSAQVRRRNTREAQMDAPSDRASDESSAEEVLLTAERRKVLMKGIRELAVLDRQLITLHLEGLSGAEIEEVTGLSQGSIATRLTRIRQGLAKRVQAESMRHE